MSKSERKSVLPAKPTHGYEFGGPLGTLAITLGLPIVCYSAAFLCNDLTGCPVPSVLTPSTLTLRKLKEETGWPDDGIQGLASLKVTGWVLAYYFLSLILYSFLPAEETEGAVLKSGGRLKYRFNAFPSAMLILSGLAVGTALQGTSFPVWTFIWENYTQIITANLFVSFFLATFVYVRSFSVKAKNPKHHELAEGGHSGNLIYDWFIGRELNPRVELPIFGMVDLKIFCEMRPGLLGWVILNLTFAIHQYRVHGLVSDSMILTLAFQSFYVLDGLYMESSILTTIDITTDGFGFMLAFGDLVWVPSIYSLQARYLAVYPVHLGFLGITGVLAVQGAGYYLFRQSNNEKNRFRSNPNDPKIKHLEYITTASGSKLLVSGWWGTSRHINYLGDWIMAWSYSLPTGIAGYLIKHSSPAPLTASSADGSYFLGAPVEVQVVQGRARGWGMVVTYFYVLYFAVLLIHRARRDDEKCQRKYGADWEEYKRRVPARIVPYLY